MVVVVIECLRRYRQERKPVVQGEDSGLHIVVELVIGNIWVRDTGYAATKWAMASRTSP